MFIIYGPAKPSLIMSSDANVIEVLRRIDDRAYYLNGAEITNFDPHLYVELDDFKTVMLNDILCIQRILSVIYCYATYSQLRVALKHNKGILTIVVDDKSVEFKISSSGTLKLRKFYINLEDYNKDHMLEAIDDILKAFDV